MTSGGYELLDFGEGRKLERFGAYHVDRPAPAAHDLPKRRPDLWPAADAVFHRGDDDGRWVSTAAMPDTWTLSQGRFVFELKKSPQGQVGLFPEHAASWDWLARQAAAAGRPLAALNLFGYTGGATLACAAAQIDVTHVDAARGVVAWARRNAKLSGLGEAPIRWIAEDASLFVRRERRRGRGYDAILLDPPSYGHGPKGQPWKLSRDLPDLLDDCAALVKDRLAFFLLSCHTPGYGESELRRMLADALFRGDARPVQSEPLFLTSADGRRLPSGAMAYWP